MNIRKSVNLALAMQDKPKKWLAQEVGIEQNSLTRILRQNSARQSTLEAIAVAFGMSVSEFLALGENDAKNAKTSHE